MKIFTLWKQEGGSDEMPWLVDAVDELTVAENDFSEAYLKTKEEKGVRELVIWVPDHHILNLFRPPEAVGMVRNAGPTTGDGEDIKK